MNQQPDEERAGPKGASLLVERGAELSGTCKCSGSPNVEAFQKREKGKDQNTALLGFLGGSIT